MSGTTSNYGLHYGTIDDATSGLLSEQQLATDVDTVLLGAKIGTPGGASALQHNAGLTLAASTGFGSLTYSWQVRNGWTALLVVVVRTGSTITAASNGNIGNTQMAALGSHLPPMQVPTLAYLVTTGVGGAAVLYPTGELYLLSIVPNGTVSAGDTIRCYFVYPA